jgi:short-subunit dehydrogenase
VVLVARRESLLSDFGRGLSQNLDVKYRVVAMDLSQEGFIDALAENTTTSISVWSSPTRARAIPASS